MVFELSCTELYGIYNRQFKGWITVYIEERDLQEKPKKSHAKPKWKFTESLKDALGNFQFMEAVSKLFGLR